MANIWSLSKPEIFQEVGTNLFVIVFNTHVDKQKVEKGRPWLFDNSLFVIRRFEGESQSRKINFDHESLWVQLYNLPLANTNRDTG